MFSATWQRDGGGGGRRPAQRAGSVSVDGGIRVPYRPCGDRLRSGQNREATGQAGTDPLPGLTRSEPRAGPGRAPRTLQSPGSTPSRLSRAFGRTQVHAAVGPRAPYLTAVSRDGPLLRKTTSFVREASSPRHRGHPSPQAENFRPPCPSSDGGAILLSGVPVAT